MKNIQEMNDTIQEIQMEMGKIKICRAISMIGTVGFTMATAFFAADLAQGANIGNVMTTIASGAAALIQGACVYNDSQTITDLKLETRNLYLEKQQLEREGQPKIMGLRRIK